MVVEWGCQGLCEGVALLRAEPRDFRLWRVDRFFALTPPTGSRQARGCRGEKTEDAHLWEVAYII